MAYGLPVHPPFAIASDPSPLPCEKKKVWDAGMAETRCKARWNQEKKITIKKSYEPQTPVHEIKKIISQQSYGETAIYLPSQRCQETWVEMEILWSVLLDIITVNLNPFCRLTFCRALSYLSTYLTTVSLQPETRQPPQWALIKIGWVDCVLYWIYGARNHSRFLISWER